LIWRVVQLHISHRRRNL